MFSIIKYSAPIVNIGDRAYRGTGGGLRTVSGHSALQKLPNKEYMFQIYPSLVLRLYLPVTASVIAVVDAKNDITRLQGEIKSLENVLGEAARRSG